MPILKIGSLVNNLALTKSITMDKSICAFCYKGEADDRGRLVAFDHRGASIVAHARCLKFSANLYQEEDATWAPKLVFAELERIKKLSCTVCRRLQGKRSNGAGCGCAYSS